MLAVYNNIRRFLGDEDKTRFTDPQILYYMNKAQLDIARKTKCLRKRREIVLDVLDSTTFSLPSDLIELINISYNGCKLTFNNTLYIETCNEVVGTPKHIIKSYTNRDEYALYPTPTEDIGTITEYTSNTFGMVDTLQYTDTATDIVNEIIDTYYDTDMYGTANYDVEVVTSGLVIQYYAMPRELTSVSSVSSESDLKSFTYDAIKYYVCSNLLREDKDTISRQIAGDELTLYEKEIDLLKIETSKNFGSEEVFIQYRRIE